MILAGLLLAGGALLRVTAQDGSRPASAPSPERGKTSYAPVALEERFPEVLRRLSAEKPQVMQRAMKELELRYDLADRPAQGVEMTRGKPIQEGVRTKLPQGVTWQALAAMAPDEVKKRGLFPRGFLPLPHAKHAEGGMVFPAMHIEATKQQSGRDLTRFDVDFDIPEHFLPEFPPAIFINQRADLGDVSKGQVITQENFFELFDGIVTPKQIDGLRLLVTPFPQQQFNLTHDRRSELPSLGVTCFDCHVNGHTNAAFHLAGEARPNAFRPRIDTPTLRGVSVQSVFGSRRALRTVEDFTEFEQRGAYFDGDVVIAVKKGVNILERGSQVHNMAEFQEMLDFPPAPKLDVFGRLDPKQATEQEVRGAAVFFGKGRCFECHPAPHYTDGTMHDLQVYRFYEHHVVNDRAITHEGMIKTFPLRGIKESPPYLHDGRLLTLEDTVEFFNLVQQLKLTDEEKAALVAFLRTL
jgi:cytochrome c peroxidase